MESNKSGSMQGIVRKGMCVGLIPVDPNGGAGFS